MSRLWMSCIAVLLAGCGPTPPPPTASPNPLGSGGASLSRSLTSGGSVAPIVKPDLAGPRPLIPVVVTLDIYEITAPFGAVSRNDEFWKKVDEDAIDIGTHDLLLKNGIRIGIGRDGDWPWFKGLLGKFPSTHQTPVHTPPGKEGSFELSMKSGVQEQNIFGLDDHGDDWGRRFEKCNDLMAISFIASPHNPGATIVKLCPKIVGMRRFFHVSILNNEEAQVEPAHPETLYDMRMEALVPLHDFLIVAPSRLASISTSLGATFLVDDGKAEPVERVLIIVPRAYRLDDPTAGQSR
ncbi:MAG TPA: hypothetical protein VN541_22650 [Tepidisphaeraceae bacterium]|nr:hypothetical protein [Tepidisphaeraceae bacterium]